jgi:hypothetical protein
MDIIEKEKENTLIMIIAHHTDITISAEENDVEKNINIPILPPPTYDQTLQALQILLTYKESRQDTRTEKIRALEKLSEIYKLQRSHL